MRWAKKPPPRPGHREAVTRFLWFPLTIQGETRWLERATWVRVWREPPGDVTWAAGLNLGGGWWDDRCWLDTS